METVHRRRRRLLSPNVALFSHRDIRPNRILYCLEHASEQDERSDAFAAIFRAVSAQLKLFLPSEKIYIIASVPASEQCGKHSRICSVYSRKWRKQENTVIMFSQLKSRTAFTDTVKCLLFICHFYLKESIGVNLYFSNFSMFRVTFTMFLSLLDEPTDVSRLQNFNKPHRKNTFSFFINF